MLTLPPEFMVEFEHRMACAELLRFENETSTAFLTEVDTDVATLMELDADATPIPHELTLDCASWISDWSTDVVLSCVFCTDAVCWMFCTCVRVCVMLMSSAAVMSQLLSTIACADAFELTSVMVVVDVLELYTSATMAAAFDEIDAPIPAVYMVRHKNIFHLRLLQLPVVYCNSGLGRTRGDAGLQSSTRVPSCWKCRIPVIGFRILVWP